LAYIGVIEGTI